MNNVPAWLGDGALDGCVDCTGVVWCDISESGSISEICAPQS